VDESQRSPAEALAVAGVETAVIPGTCGDRAPLVPRLDRREEEVEVPCRQGDAMEFRQLSALSS
jgi:hypothetical protein